MSETPSHKLEERTAYYYGEGSPEERAAFEAHLATCPDCQASLARMRELIPKVNERLQKPLDTSVDGMLKIMDRAERDLLAERAVLPERRTGRRTWALAVATLAVIAAASVLLLFLRAWSNPREIAAAPEPPTSDGG